MVQLRDFRIPEDELDRILRSLVAHSDEYNQFLAQAGETRAILSDVQPDTLRQHLLDTLDEDVNIRKQNCVKKIMHIVADIKAYRTL